jgi:hypothetical protein
MFATLLLSAVVSTAAAGVAPPPKVGWTGTTPPSFSPAYISSGLVRATPALPALLQCRRLPVTPCCYSQY